MRILTFQHKNIIEELNSYGHYICTYTSSFSKEAPMIYDELRMLLNENTGLKANPIFGWAKLIDVEPLRVNKDFFFSSLGKVNFDYNDYLLFEIDVPDNLVCLHDFFDFACFKADEEEELCTRKALHQFIFYSSIFNNRDIQAVFPVIKKDWIVDIYKFCPVIENGYSVIDYEFSSLLNKTEDSKLNKIHDGGLNSSSVFCKVEEPKEVVKLKSVLNKYVDTLESANLDKRVLKEIAMCLADYSNKVSTLIYKK